MTTQLERPVPTRWQASRTRLVCRLFLRWWRDPDGALTLGIWILGVLMVLCFLFAILSAAFLWS